MAKKVSFADLLGGSERPVTANTMPGEYTPFNPRQGYDEEKVFSNIKASYPSVFQPSQTLDYSGKYYKGSASDPSQRTIQGENQPWTSKLFNGVLGNTASVATKFATGAAEVGGGIFDAVSNLVPGIANDRKEKYGSYFPHMFENFLTKGLDYVENDLIKEQILPVYGGQKYFSDSIIRQMGDMKFWSSDVADAVAFMASAYLPAGAFTKVAKGMGMAVKGIKGLELSNKGKLFTTLATTVWNTAMEAALEGKQGLDTMRESLADKYYETGYAQLNNDQKQQINEEAAPYAANIFKANAGILLGPNLIQSRFFIGPVKSSSAKLAKAVRSGKINPNDISYLKKALVTGGTGVLSEGAWEEGMQNAVQNYEAHKADGTSNLKRGEGYLYEWLSGWNTTEGQKSMLLGAMIGLSMGVRSGLKDAMDEKKYVKEYTDKFEKEVKDKFPLYDNELSEDIRHPYKIFKHDITDKDGKVTTIDTFINPKTGSPEFDMNRMIKMFNADMNQKSVSDNLMISALNMDEIHEKFVLNQALEQLFFKYISNPVFEDSKEAFETLLARNPLKQLAEDEQLKEIGFDYDYMTSKLNQIKGEWDRIEKTLAHKEDLEADKDILDFKKLVEKGYLYQTMKLRWLEEIDSLVSEENKEQLTRIREDSQDSIDIFSNKKERDILYKKWLDNKQKDTDLETQLKEEERKDANSLESKKYRYLIEESKSLYGEQLKTGEFTITERPKDKTGELGLKNQHYFDIGADSIVGARLESEMNKVREGRGSLSDVVDVLYSPAVGTVETRGKYDVTQQDIDKVRELIPIARKQVENSRYTEDMLEEDMSLERDKIYNGEYEVGVTEDQIRKPYEDKLKESQIREQALEDAIYKLDQLESNPDGKGLLNYREGLPKHIESEDIFEREIADKPVKDAKSKINLIKNTEGYYNLPELKRIIQSLKDRKEIYEKTSPLKERLDKKVFKGYIESIDKVLSQLEKLYPEVEKNYSQKRDIDKNNQKNRNKKRFMGLGMTIGDNNEIVITDKDIHDKVEQLVGQEELRKILLEAKDASEIAEEYNFHEVFVDKIISLIKTKNGKKDQKRIDGFIKFLESKYDKKTEEFKKYYNSISTIKANVPVNDVLINKYVINPAKIFKDIITNMSLRRKDDTRKNAIDRYKNNNDVLELQDNLSVEEDTGYEYLDKNKLTELLNRHIEIESLQDIIDYMYSDYNLEDELTVENQTFITEKLAPTNQQLNSIRQIVRWWKRPIGKLTKDIIDQFKITLFIKGGAGSGKTKVIINFFMKALGVKPNEVQMLAPMPNAVAVLKDNTIASTEPILVKNLTTIDESIKLVIVDEVAALNNPDLLALIGKLHQINVSRKDPFRIILLGDPNQVSAQENTTRTTSDPEINQTSLIGIEYMKVVDPLTIKHRSIIPEINELCEVFEDNYGEVKNVPVWASNNIGEKTIGIHANNNDNMKKMLQVHKDNGRSKVIVVSTDNERKTFISMNPEFAYLQDKIYTYTEVAGTEFDEVYVSLSPKQFKDSIEFNKAFYTAISRSKQYIYIVDDSQMFEQKVNSAMNDSFGEKGSYIEENDRINTERKGKFTDRLRIEGEVMKGTKPTKSSKELTKEISDEAKKVIDNKGNRDLDEIIEDDETPDDTGQSEEDSKQNRIVVQVPITNPDNTIELQYPTYVGTRFMRDDDKMTAKLIPGGDVIYVVTEDITDVNEFTIHTLGQLYDRNNQPLQNSYAHLGIVSNEELKSQFGLELLNRKINDALDKDRIPVYNTIDIKNGIAIIKNIPETILMHGKLVNAESLAYDYPRDKEPVTGKGMFNYIFDLLSNKFFKRDIKEANPEYSVHIYSKKELDQIRADKNVDLIDKKLQAGKPYLMVTSKRKDGRNRRTQFIRLNPVNLSTNDNNILKLRKFTEAIESLEKIIGGKARFGDELFNKMIKEFTVNYYLKDGIVTYKGNELDYNDYKKKQVAGYVLELKKGEFNKVEKLMTPIITGLYGKGKRQERITSEDEMISKYHLKKNEQENRWEDDSSYWEFIPSKRKGRNYGHIKTYDKKNEKDKGEYRYEDAIVAGEGEAQVAFNTIAKANDSVNGHKIRVETISRYNTKGIKETGRKVLTGKSLISTADGMEGYYQQLRKILHSAGDRNTETEFLEDGAIRIKTESWWVTEENVEDAENKIIELGLQTKTELDKIKEEHLKETIKSNILRDIVYEGNFKNGRHSSLRTPLIMEQINKWGNLTPSADNNVDENIAKLEEVLQTNIDDILPTRVVIENDFRSVREKDADKKIAEITKDEAKKKKERDPDLPRRKGKALADTGPVYLGRPISQRKAYRIARRSIPGITKDDIKFVEKNVVNDFAVELNIDKAWGIYKNGVLYIAKNTNGTVYENIIRHEVFHKVFTEYLTETEQNDIIDKAKKEFSDYNKYTDIEELLGVKYQNWERGLLQNISDFFKSLFIRFKRLFNLTIDNLDSIDDYFFYVKYGLLDYRHQTGDGVTRTMKDIVTKFGSIDNYVAAVDYVKKKFRRYRMEGLGTVSATHEEIRSAVKTYISDEVKRSYRDYLESKDLDDKADHILLRAINDHFDSIVKDVFPGFNNYKGGIYQSKNDLDTKAEILKEKVTVNNNKHIIDNVYTNTELDITNEVKELLSYIRDEEGDLLSWRYVYVKMISMFEGLSFEQGNVLEQIEDKFPDNNDYITKNEQAILHFVKDLYNSFNKSVDSKGHKYNPQYKFLRNDLFIYSKDIDGSVDHLKHENDKEVRDKRNVVVLEKRKRETTLAFARRIIEQIRIPFEKAGLSSEDYKKYISTLRSDIAAQSMRQYNAEMWKRLVSHFNSHRQREPKIGERFISYGSYEIRYINARGNAVSNGIKDRINYMIGSRITTDKDLDNIIDKINEWKNKYKSNPVGFVKAFLNYINLPQYAGSLTNYLAQTIQDDIVNAFPKIKGLGLLGIEMSKEDQDEESQDNTISDDQPDKDIPVYTMDYLMSKFYGSLLNHLSESVNLLDNLSRILASNDANNKRRYNAILTSNAHKKIWNLINTRYGTKRTGVLNTKVDDLYKQPFYQNNIFIDGTNRIYRLIDDDGLKYDNYVGDQYSIEYKNEKREDFNFRSFVLGFIESIQTSGEKESKYIQYIYPNERKTPFGVEVNVLTRDKAITAIEKTIKQIKDSGNKSFIGFDVLQEALGKKSINKLSDTEISTIAKKIYNLLDKKSKELTDNIIYDRTAFDSEMPYSKKDRNGNQHFIYGKFNNLIDNELYPDFHIGNMPKNKSGHLKIQETAEELKARTGLDTTSAYEQGIEKEYKIQDHHIQAIASLFFINNYINSYHFAQLVAGDSQSFENTTDLVRRLSIAFAPGKAGYIDAKHGMNRYARCAVMHDPIRTNEDIEKFMKSLMPDMSEQQLKDLMKLFPKKGFKPGDSQGFMLPERLDDINMGFGEDFGNVVKGVYYHIENNGRARAIKYSSIVLSDEICGKYSALNILRNKMRDNITDGIAGAIDEVVFSTTIKVGMPEDLNDWYELTNPDNTAGFKIGSQFLIDNKDYRIQLDPEADLDSEVSYPTQLSYLMKLYGTNDVIALRIYDSLTKIMRGNFESLSNWMEGKEFKDIIDSFLEKGNQENLRELLSDGIDPNFPAITDKLLIHYISAMYDRSVHTKFSGSKLVLQTALGAEKTFENKNVELNLSKNLGIVIDDKGRTHFECIVPKGFIDKEIEKRIQQALDAEKEPDDIFFMNVKSKDLLGFRIPSSELHSAIPIKIVGFYDSKETNVVIAPDMLTVLHGSDFDIDSLFTIKRSYVAETKDVAPTGYVYDPKEKLYKFQSEGTFNENLNKIGDPRIRRKVNEAYYLNKIIEDLLDATSSEENRIRMLSPIFLGDADSESIDDGDLHSEKRRVRKLTGQEERRYDPSNIIDAQEIHNTIFTGEGGIGMFMSKFKAFAFMHLAENGKSGITRLKTDVAPEVEKLPDPADRQEVKKLEHISKLTGDYNERIEKNLTENRIKKLDSIIDELNKLQDIHIIKDNYKDNIELMEHIYDVSKTKIADIYALRGVTSIEGKHIMFNGDMYDEMVDKTVSGLTSGYRFDSLGNAALDNFKEMILPYLNAGRETINAYSVLVMHGVEFKTINNFITQPILRYFTKYGFRDAGYIQRHIESKVKDAVYNVGLSDSRMEEYLKYTPEDVKRILEKEDITNEELDFLIYQQRVYEQYQVLKTLGQELNKVVKITNAIRSYPITVAEMEDILSTAKSVMGIPQDMSITTTPNDNNSSFPYYMQEFFTTNPHVLEALRIMEWTVNKINGEFLIYDKTLRELSERVVGNTSIKLDPKDEVSKKKVRDEFVKFLMTSQVDKSTVKPISVTGRKGKEIILTGVNAFNKRFIDMVLDAQAKDHMRVMISRNDPKQTIKYQGNIFLNSLGIRRDYQTGKEKLVFYGPSSMDTRDYNLYKQSFEQLNFYDYEDINGKIIQYEKVEPGTYTKFQQLFVDYAMLNYGMSFGMRNYSKALPGRIYKDRSDKLIGQLRDLINMDKDSLNNLSDAFEAQLVLNYPEALYKNSVREVSGTKKNPRLDKDGKIVKENDKIVYSGEIDGIHYDRWFEHTKERKWPKWHIEKYNDKITVYRRITPEEGISGFYIRIGHKNTDPIYDLTSIKEGMEYNENESFDPIHNSEHVRLVKGVVLQNVYLKNKYDDLKENQIVFISDYTDPGNMYGKPYVIEQKLSSEMYRVKELKGYQGRAYIGQEGSAVRKAYNALKKQLVAKGTPFRSLNDKIYIKKMEYAKGIAYWQNVNKTQFNGLQVLYQRQMPSGMEVVIDTEVLAKWIYGQQLDMFGKSYNGDLDTYIENKIINEVTVSSEWKELTDNIFVIDYNKNERLNELNNLYNNKTTEQILNDIESRSKTKFHKVLISWMRPLLKEIQPTYIGHENLIKGLGFTKVTGEISIDLVKLVEKGYSLEQIDRIILHEFVHALTTIQVEKSPAFKAQVRKWMDHIIQLHPEFTEKHKQAFIDEFEFISEFFSKESFYDDLNTINIPSDKKSLKDRIIDWILGLLNKSRDISYAAYMDKWLRKNIQPEQFFKINANGEYTDQNGKVITESDLGWAYTNMDDTKFLNKIVEQGEDIVNPINESGDEENFYKDAEGTIYKRISDIYEGFVSLFRKTGKHLTFGERMANESWGDTDHEIKKKLEAADGTIKEFNYAEYKKEMDTINVLSIVKGKIQHLLNKLIIDQAYNDGKNEGRIKTEIQSVAYRDYKLKDSEGDIVEINIRQDPESYNWYLEKKKEIFRTHDINIFEENVPKNLKDICAAEVPIASKLLGFAGTADLIIEHADGTISIKDMASGRKFDKYISSRLLKYGDQNTMIHDAPRDRKKLQIMMYAFMIKLNNPDVKFRDLSVMWVPDRYTATNHDAARKVEVDDYLEMIKTYLKDKKALKEDGLNENIYDEIIKLSPNIFDSAEYTYEYHTDVKGLKGYDQTIQDKLITEIKDNDTDPTKMAEKAIAELTRLIGKLPVITKLGKSRYEDEAFSREDKIRARILTERILQLIKDPNIALTVNPQLDISVVTGWIGNYSDLSVPQIQVWKKFRDEQEQKAYVEFEKKDIIQKGLLRKVLDEYYKNNPMLVRNKKYLNFNNYKKMFSFMYKEFDNNGSFELRYVIKSDEEYNKLTEAQRNYIDFLNAHYKSYFEGKDAFMNSISTYLPSYNGIMKSYSVLELYNKDLKEHEKLKYYDGWFPKPPKEESEMIFEAGEGSYLKGLLNKKFIKDMWIRSLTYYMENKYEGRNHAAMVLPVKYVGSLNINTNRHYTYNPEYHFDRFTRSIEYKKYMDSVYALGEGVRMFLDMQKDGDQPMYHNTSIMFEKKLTSDVLGRTIRPQLTKKPLKLPLSIFSNYDDRDLRSDALLMLLKNWTSATLMWLKPFTGGGNGINAMLLQHKDSFRGSLGSLKLLGVEGDAIDTTLKDSLFADKVYFTEHMKNMITGNIEKDKTWLLLKKLRYLPENFDYKSAERYLLSTRNRAISESTMYSFHRIPEEAVSMITMISQLHHLKNQKTGKSLWESYKVVQLENGEYDVVWIGGVRGMYKEGSGENTKYTELKELIPQEIAKLKKVYERLQGGYRKEEAAALEVYVLGKIFIQLKKYYPRLLLNAFASKRMEADMGYLKKTAERKEGEDVYVWMQRLNEGRFRVLGKFALSTIMMGAGNRDYKWHNMPDSLKLHVIDAALTWGMFLTAFVAYIKMFGDDKDDDTMKQWWKMYLMDNLVQQYSTKELMKIGVQSLQPVAFSRSLQTITSANTMMGATWDYAFGDKAEAFTDKGDFKGWNQFRKSIPFFASYYDFVRRIENSEDLSNVLQFDQFSKWR